MSTQTDNSMVRKQGPGLLAPPSCGLSPVPLDVEWGDQHSRAATSWGSAAFGGSKPPRGGHWGWAAPRGREHLGEVYSPAWTLVIFFPLPLQESNSINHQKMLHMLTRKNHYLHIFCMLTASYLHYKCHKRVLESGSFIFSRWQKNSSLRLFLKTYFYLNNGVLLNNCTNKQIIMLRTHFEPF